MAAWRLETYWLQSIAEPVNSIEFNQHETLHWPTEINVIITETERKDRVTKPPWMNEWVHLTSTFHLARPPFSFAFVSQQPPHQRSGVLDDQTRLKSPYTFASCWCFIETAYNDRGPVPTQECLRLLSGELKQSCRVWHKHRSWESSPYLSCNWIAAVSVFDVNLTFCDRDKIVFSDAGEITKVAVSELTKLTPLC